MNQLILGIILSLLPVIELRGGLPFALNYAVKNSFPVWLAFSTIIIANIVVIFLLFLFLDFLHSKFLALRIYRRTFNFFLERARKKARKVERNMEIYGFLALTLFVAVPLPITGAWTGTLIAWILGLDRKKSILSISLGVLIAGILVLLAYFGIVNLVGLL